MQLNPTHLKLPHPFEIRAHIHKQWNHSQYSIIPTNMNWEKRLALNDIQPDSISYNLIYVDPFEEREKKKKKWKY